MPTTFQPFRWTLQVLCLLASIFPVHAVDLDETITTLRRDFFAETTPGVPGISVEAIDEAFVARLYRTEGAVDAIGRIFTDSDYTAINRRIGEIRNRLNLEIWAGIVADFGVAIELNNAGKMNGALSDLDQTVFTDAETLVDAAGRPIAEGATEVHRTLIDEFARRFAERLQLPDTSAEGIERRCDVMHFAGAGMLADWRMHDSRWETFRAQLDADVESLSRQGGAYWFPGAYKTQVYQRYLNEGRTLRLQPVIGEGSAPDLLPGYDRPEIPAGVEVEYGLTRHLSQLYHDVPITTDRSAGLGALQENRYHATQTANLLKRAKYTNREVDTGLVAATNLEVDFRLLMLQGREGVRRHFVRKLFRDFENDLPPELESLEEIQRIMEINQRIELDKIIRNTPERPAHWSAQWRSYEPRDISSVDTKLEYYDREVEEVVRTLTEFEGTPPDLADPDVRERVAAAAEVYFQRKSRAVTQLGAVQLARKLFRDLFTRDGFARQRRLLAEHPDNRLSADPDAAVRRMLAERITDLHVAMVYIDDPELMQAVMAEAPAEVRGALERLHAIAQAQRTEILARRNAVDQIEADQLGASDEVMRQLLRQLDLPDTETARPAAPNVSGQTRIASFADPDWSVRLTLDRLHEAILDRYQDGQRLGSDTVLGKAGDLAAETYLFNRQRAHDYFLRTLPTMFEWKSGPREIGTFSQEYLRSFLNVGTVDAAAKAAAAYAMGKTDAMEREMRDAILGGMPVAGDLYDFAKNLKAAESGTTLPIAGQLSTKGLELLPQGGPYAAMLGHLLAYYSLANTLYEVGWHFYGQPTQSQVISLVLTGDYHAVPQDTAASRLPPFQDSRTLPFLRENALLDTHVEVPDLPREWRELVLTRFFRAEANRSAYAVGHNFGQHSDWHAERERILRDDYFRHWRYWFQRLWFYHQVAPKLFDAMEHRFRGSNRNWQGIYHTPPPAIADLPRAQRMEEFGDAFTETADGGYWDDERVYLRLFFQDWLAEWEARWEEAQMENGEFFSLVDDAFLAGDWRRAVVDELIRYYLEGEAFYRAQPQGLAEMAGLNPAQSHAAAAHGAALEAMDDRLLADIVAKTSGPGNLAAMEELYWHPSVVDAVGDGLTESAERESDYTPLEARLEVEVDRPVGRVGDEIPFEVTVRGDTTALPDPSQLAIQVDYRKVNEVTGERPEGVLRDDVQMLLGEVKEEDLRVIEHAAEVVVTSPDDPGFELRETVPVYWLAQADPEAPTPSAAALSDEEEDAMTDRLDRLREVVERAEAEAVRAERPCESGREALTRAEINLEEASGDVDRMKGELDRFESFLDSLQTMLATAQDHGAEVDRLARELALLRDAVGASALATCQKMDAMRKSQDSREREALLLEVEQEFDRTRNGHGQADRDHAELSRRMSALRKIAATLARISEAIEGMEGKLQGATLNLGEANTFFDMAQDAGSQLDEHGTRLDGLRGEGTTLAEEAKRALEDEAWAARRGAHSREIEGLLGRLQAAHQRTAKCRESMRTALETKEEAREKITASVNDLKERWQVLQDRQQDFVPEAGITDLLAEAEATWAVADFFMESIDDYLASAQRCRDRAVTIASVPLTGVVPDVAGPNLPVAEARQMIEAAGFVVKLAGGDAAPEQDLEFRVQSQQPIAGRELTLGEPVTIVIYSAHQPMAVVPDARTLRVEEAERLIRGAKLEPRIIEGDPAPSAARASTIASQSPLPGTQVKPASTVILTVFGKPTISDRPPTRVPDVVGLDRMEGRSRVAEAGYAPTVESGTPAPEADQVGRIYRQSPAAGAEWKEGQAVVLFVYGTPSPASAPVPPPPPATEPPESDEYYVVFRNAVADNLAELLKQQESPEVEESNELESGSTTMSGLFAALGEAFEDDDTGPTADDIRRIDPRKLRYKIAEDSVVLFHIHSDGVTAYPAANFTPGAKYAAPVELALDMQGKEVRAKGALLLVCGGIYGSWEEARQAWPGLSRQVDLEPKSGQAKTLAFDASSERGVYRSQFRSSDGRMEFVGGPLVQGWSLQMKRANLELIATLCSAENAYLGSPDAVRNLALLRLYRDRVLAQTPEGRALITFYYRRFSPWATRMMWEHPESRAGFRQLFDWMANGVAALGVEEMEPAGLQRMVDARVHRGMVTP